MELRDGKLDSKISSKQVFLFCIEDKTIAVPVIVAPSFHVNIRQAHIAEETDVSLRRQVWILDQISYMFSRNPPPTFPILVSIVASCDVQWQEEKHRVGSAVLISKIEIVTFLGKSMMQAREPSLDEMADPAYPCIPDHCRCSCNSENYCRLFFPVPDFTPSKRILRKSQERLKEIVSITTLSGPEDIHDTTDRMEDFIGATSQSRRDTTQTQLNIIKRPEERFTEIRDVTPQSRRDTTQTQLNIIKRPEERFTEIRDVTSQSRRDTAVTTPTQSNIIKRRPETAEVNKTPEVKKTPEERFIEIRDDIQACVERNDYPALQKALKAAEDEEFQVRLGSLFTTVKQLVEKAIRIENLRHAILDLDQRTIAELKSYLKPPPGVLQTMQATFLMLGTHEVDIKDWAHTANLIGSAGRDNLKRRIKDIDVQNIPCEHIQAAKKKLSNLQLDDIKATSTGASAFYVWVTGMVAECESHASPTPSTSERQKPTTHSESYEQS